MRKDDHLIFEAVSNKRYFKVLGSYRGALDTIFKLKGNNKGSELFDNINGDPDNDFQLNTSLIDSIKIGIEIGLWKLQGTDLIVLDDKWDEFFSKTGIGFKNSENPLNIK